LEEYWIEVAPKDKTHPLTAWILLSTGMYHWRRGNYNGAIRTLEKSLARFHLNTESDFNESIHFQELLENIQQSIEWTHDKKPFHSFQIRIVSNDLEKLVHQQPKLVPHTGDYLIHKHMLRDRSEILKAREEKRRSRY
jgi:uncharacterized protein